VIQQSVYGTFPNIGVHGNQLLSSVIALIIGIASWFIIEKPAMNFGAKLTDRYISVFKISSNVLPIRWFLLAASRTSFKKANWASNSILAIPVIIFSIMVTYSVRTAPSSTVVKQSISEKISSYNPKRDGTSYVEATPKMLNWGPRASVVGAVPNKQPDGSMGIWIKVDDTEGLGDAQVVFDGHKIKKTIINKKLITAAIPSWLLDEMGNKEVLIMDISTGKEYQVGMFVSAAKK
jgi:hypothetical protein